MEDMDEAMRAQFPLSFGKPSKPQPHTSGAHSATRRNTSSANPAASFPNPNRDSRPDHGARIEVFEPGRAGSSRAADESRVSSEDEDDGAMIGPPLPLPMAAGSEEGDDGVIIGPPRPPTLSSEQIDSDDESESSGLDGDMEDMPRIPLSNEIVLKGHTKLWSIKAGWGSRPDIHVGDVHSDDITGLKFSTDGQVFATVGDKKEGGTHILYDSSVSQRGALVCVGRAPRKKSVEDFEVQPVIHNPHALPLFRDAPSRKRLREKALKDPMKSHKPELPVTGPGFGGRVGVTKGSLLTQYLLKAKPTSFLM
ncbi:hypothetical protein GW17_00029141 [Ensete ventricosum]|nr:hypothetical protein GW17_00029141 [Ensete ventricosum]RZR88384.1 hypothetical protein BHM03_00015949 [Ensete ventricosum]